MDRTRLKGHLAIKHQAAEKSFVCTICEKRYAYKSQLRDHFKIKHLT